MKLSIILSITVALNQASSLRIPRLINGEVAKKGQFPFVVGVVSTQSGLLQYCGGAIISEQWILTAAHCIYNSDGIVVLYDTLDLENTNNKVSVGQSWVVHHEYDRSTLTNDIGLVYLNESLKLNDNVKSIQLSEDQLVTGTDVTVTGWGLPSDGAGEKYDTLRYITVGTIENEKCMEAYGPQFVPEGVVCTDGGAPVKNPCKGDGGDPAILTKNGKSILVATFSSLTNLGCETADFPARFTRIATYRNWIRQVTGI